MKPGLAPSADKWWEYRAGPSTVFVVADNRQKACRIAEAHLRGLGVVPGGPPGLNESFERMCEFVRRGRR
jgi:hypothetical protein